MNLEVVGTGRRSLLVLPGWRLDSQTEKTDWQPVIEERDGWRALFVDLPGTGRSRNDHVGIRTQRDILDAVAALAEADGGLGRDVFAVAGTSNGGALALALAHRYRTAVHGLALRVPMVEPDAAAREVDGSARDEELLPSAPAAYREAHDRKVADEWAPARERNDSEFLAQIRRDATTYGLAEIQEPLAIEAPALVLLGRQDARVGWKRALQLTASYSRGTLAVMDRAGHALPVGERQKQLWRALVHDWLDRVEEYAAGA